MDFVFGTQGEKHKDARMSVQLQGQVPPLSDIFILTPFLPTDGDGAVAKLRHLSVCSPKFPPDVGARGGQDLLTSIGQK